MKITPETSSNVLDVEHSGDVLTVQYNSGTYDYFGVPLEAAQAIQEAHDKGESIGRAVNQVVRSGGYEYKKRQPPPEGEGEPQG